MKENRDQKNEKKWLVNQRKGDNVLFIAFKYQIPENLNPWVFIHKEIFLVNIT